MAGRIPIPRPQHRHRSCGLPSRAWRASPVTWLQPSSPGASQGGPATAGPSGRRARRAITHTDTGRMSQRADSGDSITQLHRTPKDTSPEGRGQAHVQQIIPRALPAWHGLQHRDQWPGCLLGAPLGPAKCLVLLPSPAKTHGSMSAQSPEGRAGPWPRPRGRQLAGVGLQLMEEPHSSLTPASGEVSQSSPGRAGWLGTGPRCR